MRVLAFDTSTLWCSVALHSGAEWLEREEHVAQLHSERVLPIALALLDTTGLSMRDVDLIAFGAGPGSFTGIRIATGVAQGLALGLARPVVPVSTLAALLRIAERDHDANAVVACIDARMGEVYATAAEFVDGTWRERLAPCVAVPADLQLPASGVDWTGIGSGFAAYPALARSLGLKHTLPEARPTARAVGELAMRAYEAGGGVTAEAALPVYLRHRVALTTAEREAGARL